jgi:hypothetical protein
MNHYVTLELTNRKSSVHLHVHLHALYSPRTALRMTPLRDHLMVCLLYLRLLQPLEQYQAKEESSCGRVNQWSPV